MPRTARSMPGGYCYHVINRGVGRMQLFDDVDDYLAFVRVLGQGLERYPQARLLSYCIMPNHWHLVFWPRRGADTVLSGEEKGTVPFSSPEKGTVPFSSPAIGSLLFP